MLKNGETVTNIIKLFDSKQDSIKTLLKRVPEFQEREQLIRTLEAHVEKRDEVIQQLETNLKSCEVALTRSCFHVNFVGNKDFFRNTFISGKPEAQANERS